MIAQNPTEGPTLRRFAQNHCLLTSHEQISGESQSIKCPHRTLSKWVNTPRLRFGGQISPLTKHSSGERRWNAFVRLYNNKQRRYKRMTWNICLLIKQISAVKKGRMPADLCHRTRGLKGIHAQRAKRSTCWCSSTDKSDDQILGCVERLTWAMSEVPGRGIDPTSLNFVEHDSERS